jgi:hypothetical protein
MGAATQIEPWRLEIPTAPGSREEPAAVFDRFDHGQLVETRADGWEVRMLSDRSGREVRFLERAVPGFEDVGRYERVYVDERSELRALDADGDLLTA